jgi:hypothetical protein
MRQLPAHGKALVATVATLLAATGAVAIGESSMGRRAEREATRPIPTLVTTVRLGSMDSPAGQARGLRGQPAGVPVDEEFAEGQTAPGRRALPRSLRTTVTDTRTFSAVGVTWREERAAGEVSVAVRTRPAGRASWSSWTTVTSDEPSANYRSTADTGSLRAGAELVWTGPGRSADVVVTSIGGPPPRDVRVDLIAPGTGAADRAAANRPGLRTAGESAATDSGPAADSVPAAPRAGTRAATAAEPKRPLMSYPRLVRWPVIYTRAQWGADERKRTWGAEYAPWLKAAVLHHTATTNSYGRADVPAMIRSIYHFHAVSRGWGDIGYNVIVDRYGRAWEGRVGGQDKPVIGAHAGGFNRGTMGIAMLGNNTAAKPTLAQREMVARILAFRFGRLGIDPRGFTKLTGGPNTKFKVLRTLRLPALYPHRQTSSTSCPGRAGEAVMAALRTRATRLILAAPRAPLPTPMPTPIPTPSPTPS